MMEPLESLRLLSNVSIPCPPLLSQVAGLSPSDAGGASIVASGVDSGDFYWADGQRISMLRSPRDVVVKLRQGFGEELLTQDMARSSGVLAGLQISMSLNRSLLTLSGRGLNLDDEAAVISAIESLPQVEWASPSFICPENGSRIVPTDEIIVALGNGIDPAGFFASGFSGYRPLFGTTDEFVATVPGGGLSALARANQLTGRAGVRWASPNFYMEIQLDYTPNDPLYAQQQWTLHNTGQTSARAGADASLEAAWDVTRDTTDVVVAVLDVGVQLNHPDLNVFTNTNEVAGNGVDDDGNLYVDDVHGWDFYGDGTTDDNDPSPGPYDNHGTAVAGVAAAIGSNGLGVSGAAPGARILPIRIGTTDSLGGATFAATDKIAEAVYYAAGRTRDHLGTWRGADIINCSWGIAPAGAVTDAFAWATANGRGGRGTTESRKGVIPPF